jgi:hypothetical protein
MVTLTRAKSPAEQRVADCRLIIARQREFIAKLKAIDGYCVREEETLAAFERSLVIFEKDLADVTRAGSAPNLTCLATQSD